jgi:CheY-like chemotaxis protein
MFDRFLSRAGYATETAANGAEALSVLGERDVDLVILDQMMPGMSGLEFLDRARALQPHRPLPPVLMITAAYTAELASEAIRRGAAACTSKPINRDRILFLAQSCTGRPVRGGVGGGAQGPAPEGAGGRNRLLVVEPEPLLREVLQLILSRQGYRVQAAGERQAAEDATRAEYFDLILADLHHEGRGAAELVRILRLNNPYTPILVQGVLGQPELGRELARAGATRTITRPVEVDSTLREVHRLLQLFSHQE